MRALYWLLLLRAIAAAAVAERTIALHEEAILGSNAEQRRLQQELHGLQRLLFTAPAAVQAAATARPAALGGRADGHKSKAAAAADRALSPGRCSTASSLPVGLAGDLHRGVRSNGRQLHRQQQQQDHLFSSSACVESVTDTIEEPLAAGESAAWRFAVGCFAATAVAAARGGTAAALPFLSLLLLLLLCSLVAGVTRVFIVWLLLLLLQQRGLGTDSSEMAAAGVATAAAPEESLCPMPHVAAARSMDTGFLPLLLTDSGVLLEDETLQVPLLLPLNFLVLRMLFAFSFPGFLLLRVCCRA